VLLKKKHYHDPNGLKAPVVSGIIVKRLSADGKQRFSPKLVKTGQDEKWLTKTETTITIHDQGGDIVFTIRRVPGRYCCHCQEKLIDDATGEAARAHVVTEHAREDSPDANNPSGYELLTYYDCDLEMAHG